MTTETTVILRHRDTEDDLPDNSQGYGDMEVGELLWQAALIVDTAEGVCDVTMAKRLRMAARQFLA